MHRALSEFIPAQIRKSKRDRIANRRQDGAFRNLRGLGKISESNVGDALREV